MLYVEGYPSSHPKLGVNWIKTHEMTFFHTCFAFSIMMKQWVMDASLSIRVRTNLTLVKKNQKIWQEFTGKERERGKRDHEIMWFDLISFLF